MLKVPERITFITNPHTCNLNCDICFSKQIPLDWEPVHEMDFAIIEKVVAEFAPLGLKEIIPSTIGEPFLYSRFEDFLKLAKEYNIKVSVITNGTFPNGGIKRWISLLLPVLRDIKFSAMHGKIPEWLRENISEFIYELKDLKDKPTVTIQATLDTNDTLDEIPAGVNRIKTNAAWLLNGKSQIPNPKSLICPFLTKELWVWVDGTFQVCPNPDARFGMRTRTPLGDFGNFAKQKPYEIWNGKEYKDFCNNFAASELCKTCRMRLTPPLSTPLT